MYGNDYLPLTLQTVVRVIFLESQVDHATFSKLKFAVPNNNDDDSNTYWSKICETENIGCQLLEGKSLSYLPLYV